MKFGTLVRITNINDVDRSFEKLKELGLNACQLVYKPIKYTKEDADIIRKSADKNNVDISAQFAGYLDNNMFWDLYYDYKLCGINTESFMNERLNYLFEAAKFVNFLGITDMIIHAGFIPNNPFSNEYSTMLANVKILATRCKTLNVNLLFETGGESPITLLRIIEDIGMDNIFINFDTANLIMYGYGNPVDAIYTFGKYIRNMHAKDGLPPVNPRKLGKETPLGEGYVDFKKVITFLKKINYDRYIIIEREIDGEQQQIDILKSLEYLKNLYFNV